MIEIKKMTFNPFQENTYILYDETKDCIIIDPGCYDKQEEKALADFISSKGLKPVKLVNTHGHIDHVLGNFFVSEEYRVDLYSHKNTIEQLAMIPTYSKMYGFNGYKMSPQPKHYLKDGDKLVFGNSELEVLFCPGHAPDHLVFYSKKQGFVINGDVLFQGSYGRVDLPGGDFATLKDSIIDKMFALPDDTKVYCGHGSETTIGHERHTNPINF